jgi:MFS transporter, PPP family, 3-phenylpropionic acid transporter
VALFVVLLLMFTHTSAMMPMSEAALAHLVSQGGALRCQTLRPRAAVGLAGLSGHGGGWRAGGSSASAWAFPGLDAGDACWRWWSACGCCRTRKEAAHHRDATPHVWPVLRQPAVRWFFMAVFFHVLAHIFIYVFFSLYLDSLGYSKTVIGLLWAVSVVIEIGWFFTQGRWLPLLSAVTGWLVLAAVV